MRILTVAMAAILTVSFGAAASAAKKKMSAKTVASFEQCEQLAIERGVPHGQAGHRDFVDSCMGKYVRGRQF